VHSSDPAQTVVDTSCLDGDNSWQQKQLVNLGMDAGLLGQGDSAEPVQLLQECGKFEVIVVSGLAAY
jgi:NaMN:DMB phosphoribosyltransferase